MINLLNQVKGRVDINSLQFAMIYLSNALNIDVVNFKDFYHDKVPSNFKLDSLYPAVFDNNWNFYKFNAFYESEDCDVNKVATRTVKIFKKSELGTKAFLLSLFKNTKHNTLVLEAVRKDPDELKAKTLFNEYLVIKLGQKDSIYILSAHKNYHFGHAPSKSDKKKEEVIIIEDDESKEDQLANKDSCFLREMGMNNDVVNTTVTWRIYTLALCNDPSPGIKERMLICWQLFTAFHM